MVFLIKSKKWFKYGLIILGAVFILLYFLFLRKKKDVLVKNNEITDNLTKGLKEIKNKLKETSDKAIVETIIAKTNHEKLKKKLVETAQIKDPEIRRTRLAELAKRTDVNY